jgi:hypothetical protein
MANITITVQSLLNAAEFDSYTLSDTSTLSDLKDTINTETGTDSSWYNVNFNEEVLDDANTLASYSIISGSVLGTGNLIGRLPTLEDRQLAKLNLATLDRVSESNPNDTYDIELLPSRYVGNISTPNPHPTGLVQGRPWLPYNPGVYQTTYTGYWGADVAFFDTAISTGTSVTSNFTISGPAENTSFQYLGYIKSDFTGTWTFGMASDDEAMIWIGDNAISGYTSGNALIYSAYNTGVVTGTVPMVAGYFYPVRVMYGNGPSSGLLNVTYSYTGQSATNDFTGKLYYNALSNGL